MMTSLFSLSFWLFFIAYFIAVFLAFYIPGSVLLQKLRLPSFSHVVLSVITGMALWGWQGFIFGFLQIRWASYLYLLLALVLWIKTTEWRRWLLFIKTAKKDKREIFSHVDFLLVFLVSLGMLMQLTSIFFVGILGSTGMSFCCTPPDSLYHIALTNSLLSSFRLPNPECLALLSITITI